jgi:flagellar biosynthetic protein FlhB
LADDKDDSQKTEQPTQKRLEDARKKGDVVKSQEVAGLAVLAAGALLLASIGGSTSADIARILEGFLSNAHAVSAETLETRAFWSRIAVGAGLALALPMGVLLIAAVAGHVAQTGALVSTERLKPDLNKLSPMSGWKRVFGMSAVANFVKGLAKLAIVGTASVAVLWPRRNDLLRMTGVDASAILPIARDASIALLIAALTAYALLAAADYFGQYQSFMRRQRMTKQEVRDEHRQAEGDPHVRARLRQIRQERASKRMIAAVPQATVVIANPTHYAIALKYVQGETPAPVCLAKGVDAVALKIKEVAEEHKVPIVEDPPLARALYPAVDVDREIPPEHYQAVAKIIGYVFTLARRSRQRTR